MGDFVFATNYYPRLHFCSVYSARHRLGNGRLIEILTSMLHFIDKVIYLIKKKNVYKKCVKE